MRFSAAAGEPIDRFGKPSDRFVKLSENLAKLASGSTGFGRSGERKHSAANLSERSEEGNETHRQVSFLSWKPIDRIFACSYGSRTLTYPAVQLVSNSSKLKVLDDQRSCSALVKA